MSKNMEGSCNNNQGQQFGLKCRGLAILETEVTIMSTALKRTNVWSRSDAVSAHPTLLKPFTALRAELSGPAESLDDLDPNGFLAPFLDVIRSDAVTGHVTGLALDAVHKLLSYELLHVEMKEIANAVENIADAVTRARFVGVDPRSDEVVLMKILTVLRTLMLTSVGLLLTNESVCEILQSTFRICFETRLSDLLRKTAEFALNDMIQLLFTRLPTFSEENLPLLKKLKMRNTGGGQNEGKSKRKRVKDQDKRLKQKSPKPKKDVSPAPPSSTEKGPAQQETSTPSSPMTEQAEKSFSTNQVLLRSPVGSVTDLSAVQSDDETEVGNNSKNIEAKTEENNEERNENQDETDKAENEAEEEKVVKVTLTTPKGTESELNKNESKEENNSEFVNSQGVTFTPTAEMVDEAGSLIPYGLPCVRELFRFLVSLINPHDGIGSNTSTNTTVGGITFQNDSMIHVALSLMSTALETGAEHLDKYESLLDIVKDELTRNLVLLLSSERVATFSSTLWISYLVFATQRKHLKYQMEIFLTRLMEVVNSENNPKITYEHKELVLDMVVRLYKMPEFITQLYVNYDCDLYTHNVFEDLTKMLSKNAFPVAGLYSTQFLSLDALLTVIENVEKGSKKSVVKEGGDDNVQQQQKTDDEVQDQQQEYLISSHEQLMSLKYKKKLITTASELFNTKPSKGVSYLKEQGLIQDEPSEIANFMRTNPHLDKKQIGEYISKRDNLHILKAFVECFELNGVRLDEALRIFLEAFRLPGEGPLISLIVQHFSEHWHASNLQAPIVDPDAAYVLAYAIIMLNTDQHNKNATKTNDPMTAEQFKRNVRGTNGDGGDHDQDMLDEIYHAIRNDEIVMPAEQTGLVKENYLWKIALKRGMEGKQGLLLSPKITFDRDLFTIIWGPAVAALSYVFDKSRMTENGAAEMIERSINGFQRCATIAAHYRMSDVLDNIILSLCKFSTLTTSNLEIPYLFVPQFGANSKALMATKMAFELVHKHGDILHDGWKNVLECLLWLFKCELLSDNLMEAEDYVDPNGRVKLLQEIEPASIKVESGFLNSFVSFISMSTGETEHKRPRTAEEEEFVGQAVKCIRECHVESLISESKFLQVESLQQFVKHAILNSNLESLKYQEPKVNSEHSSRATSPAIIETEEDDETKDEAMAIFYLELLVRVTIQNKDRVAEIWPSISDHMTRLIGISAVTENASKRPFLLERAVNGLLRMTVRLARKEELASLVVQSLGILETLDTNAVFIVARHVAFGLYELLRNNAANIHETEDWTIIFSLIEMVGAGITKETSEVTEINNGERTSTSEISESSSNQDQIRERSGSVGSSSGGWIVLDKTSENAAVNSNSVYFNPNAIIHPKQIVLHDSRAYLKCCDSLSFLVRDVAHITPHNFSQCVQTLKIFVEASFVGRIAISSTDGKHGTDENNKSKKSDKLEGLRTSKKTPFSKSRNSLRKVRSAPHNVRNTSNSNSGANSDYDENADSDNEDLSSEFHHVSLQLLDLMHTLHTRAAQIYFSWAEEEEEGEGDKWESNPSHNLANTSRLWTSAWCPLLQGMARLCCDRRSHIRTSALTNLQRALLFHDLQTLSSAEWEAAFTQVLFPMLSQLLTPSQPGERNAMEEIRTRAATLLGKVFLQHLTPLTTLPTFTALWLTILDFMEKFIKAATSDLLADAVPESLKNMLLVMETAGIFATAPTVAPDSKTTPILDLTWEKLDTFLPKLMPDLFGARPKEGAQSKIEAPASPLKGSEASVQPAIPKASSTPASPLKTVAAPSGHPVEPTVPVVSEAPSAPIAASTVPQEIVVTTAPTSTSAAAEIPPHEEPISVSASAPAEPASPKIEPPAPPITASDSEKPPNSPMDPPVVPSTFFFKDTLEKPKFTPALVSTVIVPPPPKFEPLPMPLGIEPLNFQPIQAAPAPTGVSQPLINPKPVIPNQASTAPLSSYFPMNTGAGAGPFQTGNLLTAAFTPTIGASNTVFLGAQGDLQPNQEVKK